MLECITHKITVRHDKKYKEASVKETVVISDDDTDADEVVLVAPVAVEGGRNMPIHVELLPEEVKVGQEEEVKEPEQNKKKAALKKEVKKVRRSIRLQQLKN